MHDTRYTIHDTRKRQALYLASCILYLASIFLFTDTAFAAKDPKEEYKKLQKEIDTHKEKLEKAKKMEHSVL
ncbi:MAG: hypothetical protein Q8K77_02345, partial [Thermodesulfovibrionales bacterium]|nr:hypothetical protein [Thermodesulfovibrionales bacterium]